MRMIINFGEDMAAIISVARQQVIDREIDKILLRTNLTYPKDSLLEIVKALNIEVRTVNFGEVDDQISGVIHRNPDKIFLNEGHSKERQTFTLAHELGHYVLHNGDKLRIDHYNYSDGSKKAKEETEANYFAASLLMPKNEFISVWNRADTVSEVAKYFGVSESAARNRVRWIIRNR